MTRDPRHLPSGEAIPVDLLRDFLGFAFQHDALRDVLTAKVAAAMEGGHMVDALRTRALATDLPTLIAEVLDAADPADWRAVAEGYIKNAKAGKLFELGPAQVSTCAERPITRPPRPRLKKTRAGDGELLPQSEYELPLLRALSQLGGTAPAWQVIEAIKPMLADRLGETDFGRMANGEQRWENRARFARLRAVERGYMGSDSRRGIWELTDEGIERLSQLEAENEEARSV